LIETAYDDGGLSGGTLDDGEPPCVDRGSGDRPQPKIER
jgi:hypothetical protein